MSPSERLVVTRAGCRYVQAGASQPVACRFIPDSGRTILTYQAPTTTAPNGNQPLGLVYLAGSRLVVSPDMVERIYLPQ